MTFLDEIYIAQRNAGEVACIANLQRMGLVQPAEPTDPQAIIAKLQGEAGVLRELLTQCASVILTITAENDTEADMLDELHERIVLALRGAE